MIHIYIEGAVLIILGYFLLKYLDGGFTFTDEILESGEILSRRDNKVTGSWFTIKRTYENGAIKIRRKEIKL